MSKQNGFPFEIHNLETAVSDELKKYYSATRVGFRDKGMSSPMDNKYNINTEREYSGTRSLESDLEYSKALQYLHEFFPENSIPVYEMRESWAFPDGFVRVDPKGYFYPRKYREEGPLIYNMEVRPSDIFVVTCPRSGTTWTQELVWLIANDLNYAKAKSEKLNERFPFLELSVSADKKYFKKLINETQDEDKKQELLSMAEEPSCNKVFAAASPRFIKSHLPISLLPPAMLDTAKVIYVARDPRDVAVSFFHMNKTLVGLGCQDFKTYWKYFRNGLTQWGPYFPHVNEAWEKRNHPNMLFLFYEELSKDLAPVVKRVADFLGKSLSEEKITELCQHLQFDNFKKNNSVNGVYFRETYPTSEHFQFIRNGKPGGWRSHFNEEMTREAEEWMSENMRDTDLRFPRIS